MCKTYWSDSSSCPGVNLDIDVYEYGPETITWTDADNDAHSYMIYVHDYDQGGVAGTGARITLYGETEIEMEVADGDSGELWVFFLYLLKVIFEPTLTMRKIIILP